MNLELIALFFNLIGLGAGYWQIWNHIQEEKEERDEQVVKLHERMNGIFGALKREREVSEQRIKGLELMVQALVVKMDNE